MTEADFNAWHQVTNACVTAGKRAGRPWTIQATTHCPLTQRRVGIIGTGSDETLASAMDALLRALDAEPHFHLPVIQRAMQLVKSK